MLICFPDMCPLLCFQQNLRCQKVWSGWSWTIKTQASTSSTTKTRAGLHWETLYPKMSAFSHRRTVPHSYTTSLLFQSQYIGFYQAVLYCPVSYLRRRISRSIFQFMTPLWYHQIWTRFLPSRAKPVGFYGQWNRNVPCDRSLVTAQQNLQAARQKTGVQACGPHEGTAVKQCKLPMCSLIQP